MPYHGNQAVGMDEQVSNYGQQYNNIKYRMGNDIGQWNCFLDREINCSKLLSEAYFV